jgi:hypothetical protein
MMIKLFGEPVTFDEEPPKETRFLQLFNRRHFPFVLFVAAIWTCQVIPMFAIYTFRAANRRPVGLGTGQKRGARQRGDQPLLYAGLRAGDVLA